MIWRLAADSLRDGDEDTRTRDTGVEIGYAAGYHVSQLHGQDTCRGPIYLPIHIAVILTAGGELTVEFDANKLALLPLD